MKIDHLTYAVEWIKGSENKEADALSRAPSSRPTIEDEIDEPHDLQAHFVAASISLSFEANSTVFGEKNDSEIDEVVNVTDITDDPIIRQILDAGNEDPVYTKLRGWIKTGFPARDAVDVALDPFIREQENFRLDGDVILFQSSESPASPPRLFVPTSLRKRFIDLLKLLHSHPNKMVARARRCLWWPFMNSDLQREHRACKTCIEKSPSNPPDHQLVHEPATYPFQYVHVDFGQYAGKQWLFGADQFSGWPFAICIGTNADAKRLNGALLQEFQKFGFPSKIYSDGGPQFRSDEFKQFCKRLDIANTLSSPYNSPSNGVAEQSVKEMKKLVHCLTKSGKIDNEEWTKAMLVYVNTPRRPLNLSPSELVFGRELRDGVACIPAILKPEHRQAIERRVQSIADYQLSRSKADKLPELSPGQRVAVQDKTSKKWSDFGVIVDSPRKRSYHVKLDSGAVVWRNRRFLKPTPEYGDIDDVRKVLSSYTAARTDQPTHTNANPTSDDCPAEPRRSSRNRRKPQRLGFDV